MKKIIEALAVGFALGAADAVLGRIAARIEARERDFAAWETEVAS